MSLKIVMLGVGNVVEGEIQRMNDEGGRVNVKTGIGIFTLNCKHKHPQGEKLSLLLKQSDEEGEEIKLKVEDVLFDRDQFQVKTGSAALSGEAVLKGGLVIHMKEAPKVGEIIRVRVKVGCLA